MSALERMAADIMVIRVRLEALEKGQDRIEAELFCESSDPAPIDTPPDLLGDLFKKPKD
jgi:hypothetical protein